MVKQKLVENWISKWQTTYNAIGAKLTNIVTLITLSFQSSAIYVLGVRRIVSSHEPTKTNFIVSCNPKNSHCGCVLTDFGIESTTMGEMETDI